MAVNDSLWLWYRLGSRQPVIIAILGVSIINIILLIDIKLTLFIIVVIIGELQYQSPLISWLMWPRPSPGVRTMPEIINRDRMSQIHTKNYHKYINTQQLWNYTKSKPQESPLKGNQEISKTNLLLCTYLKNENVCEIQVTNTSIKGWDSGRGFNCKALLTR